MEGKKLFLLDAYGLIYRAYYALIRSPRITSKGLNTSAVFGFCNTLDEVLRAEEPDHIAVCFDPPGGKTFRHEAYPEYKAQREKQPEDITLSIPYIKRILEAYRIPCVEVPNVEADDVIGTLAKKAEGEGYETYMMTLDKDYAQLVTERTKMYRPSLKGKGFEVRGPKEVCALYGINSPLQVIDLLALEGDASDNVPGCPGVGEKTASKLIQEWGSVENLIDHAAELKGAIQKKITENAEQIKFSKFLVTIKTDVDVDIDLASTRREEPDMEKLLEIYRELEFKTFIARAQARAALNGQELPPAPPSPAMGSLFDGVDDEAAKPAESVAPQGTIAKDYAVADKLSAISALAAELIKAGRAGMCMAVAGTEAMTARLYGIGFAYDDKNAYIPLPEKDFDRQEIMTLLEPLFCNDGMEIVSHDMKRDMILLKREGIDFKARYFDTSVAHYLLKPEGKHGIDTVAYEMLGYRTLTYDMSDLERKKDSQAMSIDAAERCAEKARVALTLKDTLLKAVAEQDQTKLLEEIEMPMVEVLASMEWEGARIDVRELARISVSLSERISALEDDCYAMAGEKFNVGSPSQVGEILFGKMGIDPKAKKTKNGAWSTTEETLEKYKKQYPLVDKILEARGLKKLLATYADALPKLINPITGKLHTTYQQTVTATGRLSSTNPNLQNIPIRTDDGREIRRAFIPDDGDLLLSADYSQIELRLMADFSGDKAMVDAFNSGEDIHRETAAKIYGIPLEEVTDNQRRNAKTANFGIIYGISAFGLSQRLEIPRAEAKMLIDGYLATYPGVKAYMDQSIEKARRQGYVSTIMGRKRYLPDIASRNATVRGYAERNAINAPLQGSAADIIKIAMIRIHRDIVEKGLRSRMILQVHDELVFNVKAEELAQVQQLVAERMEHAYSGRVALEVSSGVGTNWLEAH
ncbi:MAG: DNA polymerase I [Clostridium sp.]|nr:DNA polymerase I [Clostridium sp.]